MRPFLTILSVISFLATSCTEPRIVSRDHRPHLSENFASLNAIWEKKILGRITDLKVAHKTASILIAAVPDYDQVKTLRRPVTQLWNAQGRLVWQKVMRSRVRKLAVSDDHHWTALATYDENLRWINQKGKEVYRVPKTFCTPKFLNQKKQLFCFYDDESHAGLGYRVFDYQAKEVVRYPTEKDVIGFDFSSDESFLGVAYAQGEFEFFDSEYCRIWSSSVPGEIIDLTVSNGPRPKLAVLFQKGSKKTGWKGQRLVFFDSQGKVLLQTSDFPEGHRIDFHPKGQALYLIGNQNQGQHLTMMSFSPKLRGFQRPEPLVFYEHEGDFPKKHQLQDGSIWVDFEKISIPYEPGKKMNHVLGFDLTGKLKWSAPLSVGEGLFLYGLAEDREGKKIAISSDNSTLRLFSVH